MKRLLRLAVVALAVGGTAAIVMPLQPAHATEVVRVCLTVSEKKVLVDVNGSPVGLPGPGLALPRTCLIDI